MLKIFRALKGRLSKQKKQTPLMQELEDLVEGSQPGAFAITDDERHLLANVFQFRGLTAHDIMKPRADIQALEVNSSLAEVVHFFQTTLASCVPVYKDQLDETLGLVCLNDVLPFFNHPHEFRLNAILKDVLFVSPSIRILELMIKMRVSRASLALVVDEFGGIDGLVTLEDVVEEIVGKIQEGQSLEGALHILKHEDGSYLADARTNVNELQSILNASLTHETLDEDIQTLGGLLTHVAGRVPACGEVIGLDSGFECEIRDADPRRIKQVLIRPVTPSKSLKVMS